mmetsp:Transcript_4547/g.8279  ORF Transcript_4547/g.8279 Transcript_4547/m.8279 type:complete len:224 (-) Transcript_4547:384-1055(-)|eukprot:CAMPEP_0177750928 /NCGR_PEP_ID=MMETSP0491_2-20121128/100_1 /TAXON_ID=63592 /ORGANISM="Tetraselmis chuii, Strain PLY429" /LENGTH=223 /DNA_ID=CAMNT_0019266003 /DNA_START=418 /DNA_END=1089 /DNA_ORIENTATION=-
MDWNNVTAEELVGALQEVEWNSPPRPLGEFFAKFAAPKNQAKWNSRVKCNVYYYRTNYVLLLLAGYLLAFFRNPLALLALGCGLLAGLLMNDTFARSFSEKFMRGVRKVNPRLAQKLRAAAAPGGSTLGTGSAQRGISAKQDIKIAGVSRVFVVAGLALLTATLVYMTGAILTLAWGTFLGLGSVSAHASFRSPNLKARLASAREEFKAVWRGYGDFSHDYTL